MNKLLSRKSLVLLAMLFVNIVNALSGLLSEALGDDVKEILTWAGVFQYRLHITTGLFITGLLVAVWVVKADKDESKDRILAGNVPESDKVMYEVVADLAGRYKKRYAHKLDGRYEISLVVSDDLDDTYMRQFDDGFSADARTGEAAQYIIERFERRGRLLIVGGPGSGKTVLLLALALYLVKKALEDASQPLPVIFNLASWSPTYERFDEWMTAMLTRGYGLSPEFAGQMLAERRIVFLLDGLDELARNEEPVRAAEVRAECLAALDKYLYDGSMSVAICCRREQFIAILRQTGAEPPVAAVVAVQDLTAVQIDRALIRACHTPKDKFAAPHLLSALGQDRDGIYQQVLSTPFYFTTALQVFDSNKPPKIDAPDRETLEVNLITAFVEKKLAFTENPRRFNAARTHTWLIWLAHFLNDRKQVTFELASLQPTMLKRPWRYRFIYCTICGVAGVTIGTAFGSAAETDNISLVVMFSAIYAMIFAIIGYYFSTEDFMQWTSVPLRRWRTWRRLLWAGVAVGVLSHMLVDPSKIGLLGIESEATVGIGGHVIPEVSAFLIIVLIAIFVGATGLVFVRMFFGILGRAPIGDIATEDFARWTLKPLLRWCTWRDMLGWLLFFSMTGGIIGSAVGGVFTGMYFAVIIPRNMFFGFAYGVLLGVALLGTFGAAFSLFVGIPLGVLRACRTIARFASIDSPYQRLRAGIVFNVLQGVVIAMVLSCLVSAPGLFIAWTSPEELKISLLPIIRAVILLGTIGLLKVSLLKHFALRICLYLEGSMPLHYADFLSYATELHVLEKEGGQWRFRHQILQDYFARLLIIEAAPSLKFYK